MRFHLAVFTSHERNMRVYLTAFASILGNLERSYHSLHVFNRLVLENGVRENEESQKGNHKMRFHLALFYKL